MVVGPGFTRPIFSGTGIMLILYVDFQALVCGFFQHCSLFSPEAAVVQCTLVVGECLEKVH